MTPSKTQIYSLVPGEVSKVETFYTTDPIKLKEAFTKHQQWLDTCLIKDLSNPYKHAKHRKPHYTKTKVWVNWYKCRETVVGYKVVYTEIKQNVWEESLFYFLV